MKKSTCGNHYQNFQHGRVYVKKGDRSVTIKAYQTWKGKDNSLKEWICISFRAKQPRVYRYVPRLGIRNITYVNFYKQIIELISTVSHAHRKQYLERYKAIERKIITICGQICGINFGTFQKLTIFVLKDCLPLLSQCDDKIIQRMQTNIFPRNYKTLLSDSSFRSGLKRESLAEATEVWFGKSPPGLIKRTGQTMRVGNINSLFLAIACRDWNLDNLYSLMDRNYIWYEYLEIEDVRTFISNSYSPKRWFTILDKSISEIHNHFVNANCFEDSLQMFDLIKHFEYRLPKRPRTIQQVHDGLAKEYSRINNWKVKDLNLPAQRTFLDELEISEFRLMLPKVGEDLIHWGDSLNNCLASYVTRVLNKKVEIVGIFKEQQIKYAVSISNNRIQQFLGFRNSVPAIEEEKLIREAFSSWGIS